MAKKATFYILESKNSPKEQAIYTCRIIEKAFNNGFRIYIHTDTPDDAQNFDAQLWTFGDISFVPHELYPPQVDQDVPVLISHNNAIPTEFSQDTLVNLTPSILPFYQQFSRFIESIPNDENLKAEARKRFKAYKDTGYETEDFNI